MSRTIAFAFAFVLCAVVGPAWAGDGDSSPPIQTLTDTLQNGGATDLYPSALVVDDQSGQPIVTINVAEKSITVADGVKISDAAKRVFEVLLKTYIPQCRNVTGEKP